MIDCLLCPKTLRGFAQQNLDIRFLGLRWSVSATFIVSHIDMLCHIALAVYEYILTVKDEITLIWMRKWSVVTCLFVLNRYVMVASAIVGVAPFTATVSSVLKEESLVHTLMRGNLQT